MMAIYAGIPTLKRLEILTKICPIQRNKEENGEFFLTIVGL